MKDSRFVRPVVSVAALALVLSVVSFGQSGTESSSKPAKSSAKQFAEGTDTNKKNAQKTETAIPIDETYKIGVEDELQITVWREPELSAQVMVRPDGVITLPLLEDVQVVGLTTTQLREKLEQKLKAFVTEPQVSITVRQIRSRKVYLVGSVPRPGAYQLNGQKTVLQLLAEAGGLGPFAKGKSMYILRDNAGQRQRLPFNYKQALKDPSGKNDLLLVPGDMIVVP